MPPRSPHPRRPDFSTSAGSSAARPGDRSTKPGTFPGAVYVDLDTELAGHGLPIEGRHPLPDIETLQAAARRWGVNPGDSVVVYDDLSAMSAARAWWLLRYAGFDDVRVLDGGLATWITAGYALETGAVDVEPGSVELAYGHLPTLDGDQAAAVAREGVLLDARAGERYRGETEPIDPRAGHIPGAVSAPTTENLGSDGRFLPPEQLAARFAALGVRNGCAGRHLLRLRHHLRSRTHRAGTRRLRRRGLPGVVVGVVERSRPPGGHGAGRGVTVGNSALTAPGPRLVSTHDHCGHSPDRAARRPARAP